MDIGSIFLILGLMILVGVFVSRPFFEGGSVTEDMLSDQEEHAVSALLAERDRVLNALQELEFDYTMGKIPEEDYPGQREALVKRGAEVLRQLDQYHPQPSEGDADDRVEAAVEAHRADKAAQPAQEATVTVTDPDDDLEVMIAIRRRARQEKATGFCPKCGGPVQKSDRFCPKCGQNINGE
jgi:hypothetical protein